MDILAAFNRNTFVDRRKEERTTLDAVFDHYPENAIARLKGRGQAASQVRQLKVSSLASRFIADITPADIIAWLAERRAATVRKKAKDENGRVVKRKDGRLRVVCYEDRPLAEKTILNELLRLSAVFVHARVAMGMATLANPTSEVPTKIAPRPPRERAAFRVTSANACSPHAEPAGPSTWRRSSSWLSRRPRGDRRSSIS